MPSHADRIRRHSQDANPPEAPSSTEPDDALTRLLPELERYAGWLDRDHVSVAVRAGVQTLIKAVDAGDATLPLLLALEKDLGRLPSGGMRKMLRNTLSGIRAVLEPSDLEARDGDGRVS